mgnify:CR=1 FL=1
MVDTVALLVRELLANPGVSAVLGDRVYGGSFPEDAAPPFAVVRGVSHSLTAPPSMEWWDSTVTIDIHSNDPIESISVATKAAVHAASLEDVYPEGAVASVRLRDILSIEDGAFTPTRSRNIVTVAITARNN